jgi:hypothetical protein
VAGERFWWFDLCRLSALDFRALSLSVEILEKTADDLPYFIMSFTFLWPNKTLEPTADGAVSSAIAGHAASRRWLSFFR